MKRLAALCSGTLLIAALTACNTSVDKEAIAKTIKDDEAQWVQDYAAKDANKIVNHYADDAIVIAPGMPASNGKAAINDTIKGMVTDPALNLKFTSSQVEVAQSGDLAYTRGSYTMTFTNPATKQPMTDHGSYVTTYRKQSDGSWKAVTDIASSELPPSPPSASSAQ